MGKKNKKNPVKDLAEGDEAGNVPSETKQKSKKKANNEDWLDDVQNELLEIEGKVPAKEVENEASQTAPKKKGKKGKKVADDWEDDIQNEITNLEGNEEAKAEQEPEGKKTNKKKGKKKKNDDNWEDDVQNELMNLETNPDARVEEKDVETKKPNKKKGKKKRNDDNWEDEVQNELMDIENNVPVEPEAPVKKKASKGAKSQTEVSVSKTEDGSAKNDVNTEPQTEESASSKKKQKKKKKTEKSEEEKPRKGGPGKAQLKAMKEALQKQKEAEEKLKQAEEEKIRKEEEAERLRLEALEAERLRKEKKKQDKKDKIQQLKKEGKYLTPAQREQERRRELRRQELIKSGMIPDKEVEIPKKPKYERKKKNTPKMQQQHAESPSPTIEEPPTPIVEDPKQEEQESVVENEVELDDWETLDEKMENLDVKSLSSDNASESEASGSSESEEESNDDASSEDSVDDSLSSREQALRKMQKRKEENNNKRSVDNLRSPIVCVLGHVDTGKTKILDKIRHSHVQDGEAGGITQQIGATNVPVYAIKEQSKMVKNFQGNEIKIPGLLVIDTPGHESFGNLRSRGSSNCDIAILVVDIMHGLEPQTIESIGLLKKNKTPFVVALNKVDRLYEWKSHPENDIATTLRKQKQYVLEEFREKVNGIIVQFAEQSLNVKLFHENDDPETWISMVPTSAHSGDGMGNLIALVVKTCETKLARKLAFSENLQCTVLEVKAIQGLGTTIDVVLTNGRLKYGDTIVLPGTEGPIVTHIKGLLMPQPLRELRVKNPYDKFNEIQAAYGIKILAKDMDKALAGTSLLVAYNDDEIEILKEEVQAEVSEALGSIKLKERGVFVQASTLGSLEALLEFLKQSKIPYAGISIGPVCKKDVVKASVMLEHDTQWAVILAFDVKVEREAQEIADSVGVKIFTADIIYHLFDAFMKHREDLKKQKQDEYRQIAVFPCKVQIVPNCVFKSRDPIIVGVKVETGQLRLGTPLCVPNREFLKLGIVTSMQVNHKDIEVARNPQEVCIKIEGVPGEAPKMVGRHFDETDVLVSKITRDSIDALKTWFREEMQKNDWQLTIELKKLFEII
uniref:Eukaryotic translation initiation factor 5B n=1 Tax=Phallusia mammillata TaxID=59560 RepID=A0A6F9DCD8_9ASCI|nr:eukaryotic translation initiation factor 5B-like [Phallusia mammillata]